MTADFRNQLALSALRTEIDAIDRRLVDLLDRRARAVRALAPCKAALGLPPIDHHRERTMAAATSNRPADGLLARDLAALRAAARRVFRRIAAESTPA